MSASVYCLAGSSNYTVASVGYYTTGGNSSFERTGQVWGIAIALFVGAFSSASLALFFRSQSLVIHSHCVSHIYPFYTLALCYFSLNPFVRILVSTLVRLPGFMFAAHNLLAGHLRRWLVLCRGREVPLPRGYLRLCHWSVFLCMLWRVL